MTRAQVLKLIGLIKAAWPRDEMSPDTAKAYAEDLVDLDHEATMVAFLEIRRSHKFRPHQSEIREAVAERELSIPSAADAWKEVSERVHDYDDYDEDRKWPEWSHPLIKEVVKEIGGLRALYYSQMPGADRSHFLKLYGEHRAQSVTKRAVGELPAPKADVKALPSAAEGDHPLDELRRETAKSLEAS